jgi:hypothetical protein
MSAIQHAEAERLLDLLSGTVPKHNWLTYSSAAEALGRDPKKNARMVAQCCDLLDAAAVLAGVPLLALYWVREKSLEINAKAWKDIDPAEWEAIIDLSARHSFVTDDFTAIRQALDELSGRGNHAAWEWLKSQKAYKEFWKIISETQITLPDEDAIDDLGSDRPELVVGMAKRYRRDPNIRKAVLQRATGKCEYCGKPGFLCADGSPYLESHHIIALADDGVDRMNNVIALCPGDHREAHFGKRRLEIEKEMVRIVASIEKL